LRKKFNAEIEYVPGDGGVYEIVADGREVFVKARKNASRTRARSSPDWRA